jgi:hypothetical protein
MMVISVSAETDPDCASLHPGFYERKPGASWPVRATYSV